MNDKELADKVVALGVAEYDETAAWAGGYMFHNRHGNVDVFRLEHLVTDWRVAGALMEKVRSSSEDTTYNVVKWIAVATEIRRISLNEVSLPRAIIEACVKSGILEKASTCCGDATHGCMT